MTLLNTRIRRASSKIAYGVMIEAQKPSASLVDRVIAITNARMLRLAYRRVPKFEPMVQCVVHALKGLARHSACLALQAVLSAHVAFAPSARLRQSF